MNFGYSFHVNLHDAKKLFTRLIPGFLFLVTLAISPGLSIDPINAPKFLILTVFGVISIGLVLPNLKFSTNMDRDRFISILMVGLFTSGLVVAFLRGETSWKEQFFGVNGRNTGFVTYVSLAFIFLALVIFFSRELLSKSIMTLVVCGSISSVYGLLQFLDLDPVRWNSQYSPIIGFLGNPNFQSSFVGMASVALFDRLFRNEPSKFQKGIVVAGLLLNLFIVVKSDSQQGLLVFLFGTSIILLGHLSRLANKIYFKSLTLAIVVLGILASMGLLQKGPFASVLYQPSVTFRGDYWRAGIRMFRENLLNGLGLDSFGSFYRQYRDTAATLRRGPEITTNAAHNVVIDLAANGGLLLVVPYILLMFFTFWLFIRALKADSEDKSALILVFSLWLCYQAQSLISINLVSLATWGWVFMGLLAGLSLDILREKAASPEKVAKVKANSSSKEVSAGAIVLSFICAILGTVVGVLPLSGSTTERSAIQSGSVDKVIEAAFKEPRDPDRMNNLAAILGNGGYPEEALKIAKATVREFPTSFVGWRIISQINNASPLDKEQALKKMRELDPLNQNLR